MAFSISSAGSLFKILALLSLFDGGVSLMGSEFYLWIDGVAVFGYDCCCYYYSGCEKTESINRLLYDPPFYLF